MKRGVLCILFLIIGFGISAQNNANTTPHSGVEKVLELSIGTNNPRNSEGDFITLKDGQILFVYSHFTGKSGGDFGNGYLASRFSTDHGKTWSSEDKTVVGQEGDMNVMSVSLLRLKNGSIALFYARKNSDQDCMPMMRISRDEAKTWSDPISCINDRKGYYVLNNNRVIQLTNGRIIMPVSLHNEPDSKWSERGRLFAYYSDDNGQTWKCSGEVANPKKVITQEPGVVEQKNGDLFMFIRTNTGVQYASFSKDNGETWNGAEPIRIASPQSPASIVRMPSTGDLVMVWNNNGTNQKRTPLNVAVSKDEGKNWERIKIIENDPDGVFCYTAIHFTGNEILLAYFNWKTMGITLTRVSLEWIYK